MHVRCLLLSASPGYGFNQAWRTATPWRSPRKHAAPSRTSGRDAQDRWKVSYDYCIRIFDYDIRYSLHCCPFLSVFFILLLYGFTPNPNKYQINIDWLNVDWLIDWLTDCHDWMLHTGGGEGGSCPKRMIITHIASLRSSFCFSFSTYFLTSCTATTKCNEWVSWLQITCSAWYRKCCLYTPCHYKTRL